MQNENRELKTHPQSTIGMQKHTQTIKHTIRLLYTLYTLYSNIHYITLQHRHEVQSAMLKQSKPKQNIKFEQKKKKRKN